MTILQVRDLNYTYPDGRQALKGVNMEIAEAEKVGLLGLNGAGKSTMLLSIAGVLKAEGEIKICGIKRERAKGNQLKEKVGLVFQDPNDQLFMTTVWEDVAFGPQNMGLNQDEVERRVQASLKAVDAAGFEDRLTHHLSFGEKKRVALATVLAMEPALLLLDEPSSNLDPKRRREFRRIIGKAPQGMIIATHDLELVKNSCTRVIILEEGQVITDSPVEILDDQEFLKAHDLY